MFCSGKFHSPNSIIPTKGGKNGRKTKSLCQKDGRGKEEVVRPPPYPPGVKKAAAGELSVRKGVVSKTATDGFIPQTTTFTWKNLIPWLVIWYASSVCYGLMTKNLLREAYYPWSVATFQMLFGLLFQLPLWYLNLEKCPELTWQDIKALIPLAFCQLGVHVGATIATGLDEGLPIAHVVKALEPIVTLVIDYKVLKRAIPLDVLLGLIPLSAGLMLPHWTTHKFNPEAIIAATFVVACSSARVVLSHKILVEQKVGKNLHAKNLFAVLSITTALILIPITLQCDGLGLYHALSEAKGIGRLNQVIMNLCISGSLYYLFNGASFTLMAMINPTTHAVANLMRRPMMTFIFILVNTFHRFCNMVSLKLTPLSFLIWDQRFRETHTIADVLRSKGEASITARIPQPSVDSLVGSILGFVGCLIYLKETEDESTEKMDVETTTDKRKNVCWKERIQRQLGPPQ
ncbi:triose-phosphate transporter family protein [Nitzschia inconspicua]|uniref:Triose-phosphate transporter family protein n=1 Tax=Nitzschia inconspicua TaxID=303405 RepID=A0A9K3KEX1_9STRA|nr:triose-phosphate transporter family protein [Nitzschia inconspicua]